MFRATIIIAIAIITATIEVLAIIHTTEATIIGVNATRATEAEG